MYIYIYIYTHVLLCILQYLHTYMCMRIYIYVYITTPTFSNATEAAGIRAEMSLAFCDPAFLPPGGEVAAGGIIDKTRHLKRVFV